MNQFLCNNYKKIFNDQLLYMEESELVVSCIKNDTHTVRIYKSYSSLILSSMYFQCFQTCSQHCDIIGHKKNWCDTDTSIKLYHFKMKILGCSLPKHVLNRWNNTVFWNRWENKIALKCVFTLIVLQTLLENR